MKPTAEPHKRPALAEPSREQRLASYRALLESCETARRQAVARRRLVRLRRDANWGWLAL